MTAKPRSQDRGRTEPSRSCPLRPKETAMTILNTEPNLPAPDDFYDELIALHRDLTDEQSRLVNAKLVLLLANHVGDREVLRAAMAAARADVAPAR